jgi:hypothetical protein
VLIGFLSWGYERLTADPGEFRWEKRLFKYRLFFRQYDQIEAREHRLDRKLKEGEFERCRLYQPFNVAFVVRGNHEKLRRWCRAEPDSYLAYALMGRCDLSSAWNCRGGAWAGEVSGRQWSGFYKWLEIGRKHLEYSYELNPDSSYAATEMITYCMGKGKSRDEMELWYDRAIKAEPWSTYALNNKLEYLQPKWCGSLDEMMAFARECMILEAPSYFSARSVGTFWQYCNQYKERILLDQDFIRQGAYACKRHYDLHHRHAYYLRLGAFFALHSGEYQLAAEMFEDFRWDEERPDILTLWENEEEFAQDKELALKMAATGKGKLRSYKEVLIAPVAVESPDPQTPLPIVAVVKKEPVVMQPSAMLKEQFNLAGIAQGKNGCSAVINNRAVSVGDDLGDGAVVLEILENHVDLLLDGETYRFLLKEYAQQ